MKELKIETVHLRKIDPAKFVMVCYIGGDDTLLRDGNDIINDYKERIKKSIFIFR